LTYDVFNDFRENYSESTTVGIDFNVAGFVIFIVPVIIPLPIPDYAYHETKLRTATTTKVIHRSAIMTEKVARDLGSSVSTKYLAWDAHTGQALLTETINEYDDNYYNFTYPTHWYYEGMDMASINIGASGVLSKGESEFAYSNEEGVDIFMPGDELQVFHIPIAGATQTGFEKLWVAQVEENGGLHLMNSAGEIVNNACEPDNLIFKIVRSGYRNQQAASMSSVTSQRNPITTNAIGGDGYLFLDNTHQDPRIINTSAVQYHEAWRPQWESNLPAFPDALDSALEGISYETTSGPGGISTTIDPRAYGFNPYLYNVRGEWRARRSYAYLSGRQARGATELAAPRYEGYLDQFNTYYTRLDEAGNITDTWHQDQRNWTFASEVTQYSPYGAELENRDALGRHSAAQYGYNYTLPTAVASNSRYDQIGFDGFEDYTYQSDTAVDDVHFGFFSTADASTAIVENASHSGRHSLKVTGETSLVRDYGGQDYEVIVTDPNCNDNPPPPPCDEDTINVNCIDVDMHLAGQGVGAITNVNILSYGCFMTNEITVSTQNSTTIVVDIVNNSCQGGNASGSILIEYTQGGTTYCWILTPDDGPHC